MKKLIFFFLFTPVFFFSQEHINLKNNILDSIMFFPIGDANIYNFDFKSYLFTIKGINLDFLHKKKDTNDYKLPETYAEFKSEFLNTNFIRDNKKITDVNLTQQEIMNAKYSQHGLLALIPGKVGEAVMHPITFLYNTFSRKAKMERLYQDLVSHQEEVYNLSQKYNQELVASLTGLEGEDLLDFMTYCKFSYYDLIHWSPEYIVLQIKRKYGDYEYFKAIEDY
jgi:hypothetical protein